MDLAKEFNLCTDLDLELGKGSRQARGCRGPGREPGGGESDKDKIHRLEKELARKEEELEILGKALAFFARRADQ